MADGVQGMRGEGRDLACTLIFLYSREGEELLYGGEQTDGVKVGV